MNASQIAAEKRVSTPSQGEADTQLRGYPLMLARTAWVVIAVAALALWAVTIPPGYAQFLTVCTQAVCRNQQATPELVRALHSAGLSLQFYALYLMTLAAVVVLIFCALGAIIAWRRSRDWMALLVSLTLVIIGTATFTDYQKLAAAYPLTQVPGDLLQFLLSTLPFLVGYLFPNGRFVPRWTRWLALLVLLFVGGSTIFPTSLFNSDTWPGPLGLVAQIVVLGTNFFTQIYRYLRVSTPVQRQQTKWVVFGITALIIYFIALTIFGTLDPALTQANSLGVLFAEASFVLALIIVPLTIAFSILRYRLWDINLLINRTLVYSLLTAFVIGMYVLVVGYLGAAFRTNGNLLISLIATGFVAVLFQPLRGLLQRGVNRLLYGLRDEPYVVLAGLGQRLKTTLDSDAVLSTIVATVREALKLSYAAIEVQEGTDFAQAATSGTPPAKEALRLPLVYQGEPVGMLLIAPRGRDDALTPADLRLLDDLTHQIGNAVHTVRLTSDLQALTQDLQRSREHLVSAREEERRRLRRDLHDGLGPMLSAIMLKVGLVRTLHRRDPETTGALLNQLEAEIESVIGDIRRVVYNLRPPALDELGLVGAIREYVARLSAEAQGHDAVLTVTVEAPEHLPALPAAVEVAAYRIVQEAVTNVLRHAHAQSCRVRFLVEEALQIEVSDDGAGFEEAQQAGVGLTSMRERAEELGGTFTIRKTAPGGTEVTACLPLSHAARERVHV
jgi:signal transduction histidine kinase